MNTKTRIEHAEAQIKALVPDALIVNYELPDGTWMRGSVDEMLANGGGFGGVVSGNSLEDLQKILDNYKKIAMEELKNEHKRNQSNT